MFDITMGVPEMKEFWDDLKKELRMNVQVRVIKSYTRNLEGLFIIYP